MLPAILRSLNSDHVRYDGHISENWGVTTNGYHNPDRTVSSDDWPHGKR
jgi:hypothetical protein